MSIDQHHVMNFWGASPALDLKGVVASARSAAAAAPSPSPDDDAAGKNQKEAAKNEVESSEPSPDAVSEPPPLTALLVGTGDPRHIFTTLARSRRHGDPEQALHFHVHESNMVGRCRLTPGTPWFSQLTPRLLSGTFTS